MQGVDHGGTISGVYVHGYVFISILIKKAHVVVVPDAVKNLAHTLQPRPGAYPGILPAREVRLPESSTIEQIEFAHLVLPTQT